MLYGIYVPTARTPVAGLDLERFPSREQAQRELRRRTTMGGSATWYVRDWHERRAMRREGAEVWADADDTNYMRVFLRYAHEPVPSLTDVPDEEWIVEPGLRGPKVLRLPWEENPGETLVLRKDGVRILPSTYTPVRPPAGRTAAAGAKSPLRAPQALPAPYGVCDVCFQERTATVTCGCADSAGEVLPEIRRPSRLGWGQCSGCGLAVTAYARCGCS